MRQKYITKSGSWACVKNILKALVMRTRQKYIKNSDSCARVKNILQTLVPAQAKKKGARGIDTRF